MDVVNDRFTRQNLNTVMDKVVQDRAPLLITRQKGEPVVMMALDDYNALEETAFLLRSPKNTKRLMNAIASLRAGQGVVHKIL